MSSKPIKKDDYCGKNAHLVISLRLPFVSYFIEMYMMGLFINSNISIFNCAFFLLFVV